MKFVLHNAFLNVTIGDSVGATALVDVLSNLTIAFAHDTWSVQIFPNATSQPNATQQSIQLTPSTCTASSTFQEDPFTVTTSWNCTKPSLHAGYIIDAVYHLARETRFVSKQLRIRSSRGHAFWIARISLWDSLEFSATTSSNGAAAVGTAEALVLPNDFDKARRGIAAFARWPLLRRGAFAAVANPFTYYNATATADQIRLSASYQPGLAHEATSGATDNTHVSERAVIGPTALTRVYRVGAARRAPTLALNSGEQRAFTDCVEALLLDSPARAHSSVKVRLQPSRPLNPRAALTRGEATCLY